MAEVEMKDLAQSEKLEFNVSDEPKEENALNRVANIPVVASTWNAMHAYYCNVKQNYPNVTPYLETAEKLTSTAANIALTTSRPVVNKLAPTVNSYANLGLDKLEHTVPIITKEPKEIYEQTKSTAANMLTNRVNNVLDATDKYVDYYLPGEANELEYESDEDEDLSSDESDNAYMQHTLTTHKLPLILDISAAAHLLKEEEITPRERIQDIKNKVRHRSSRRVMMKFQGLHVRSKEALGKLHFTVDLIQYAQETFKTSQSKLSAAANDAVFTGVMATIGGIQDAADSVNKQVEERVLVRARSLIGQLNKSCETAVSYLKTYPRLHQLLEQANIAKKAAEDLISSFAGKTSISQLPTTIVESTRTKVKIIEHQLLTLFERLQNQSPIDWLMSKIGVGMQSVSKNKEE